jgi:hypothetical protein
MAHRKLTRLERGKASRMTGCKPYDVIDPLPFSTSAAATRCKPG